MKIDALNLVEKQKTEIKSFEVAKGDGITNVVQAMFMGQPYDKKLVYYNQQVSHDKFITESQDLIGLL